MSSDAAPRDRYGAYGPGRLDGIRVEMNLRELGGYATADGRTTRRGLLFRGPRLGDLTPSELAIVEGLGLRSILDLRSASEADEMPDPALAGATHLRVAGMYVAGTGEEMDFSPQQLQRLGIPELTASAPGRPQDMMLESYMGMTHDNPALHTLFSLMLEGGPVLFHCTSGKDRTGVAAFLALVALGVSVEDALFDYDLTNAYRSAQIGQLLEDQSDLLSAHPEMEPFLKLKCGVDTQMARDMAQMVVRDHGSFDRYFEEELGLGASERERLRELYVV